MNLVELPITSPNENFDWASVICFMVCIQVTWSLVIARVYWPRTSCIHGCILFVLAQSRVLLISLVRSLAREGTYKLCLLSFNQHQCMTWMKAILYYHYKEIYGNLVQWCVGLGDDSHGLFPIFKCALSRAEDTIQIRIGCFYKCNIADFDIRIL